MSGRRSREDFEAETAGGILGSPTSVVASSADAIVGQRVVSKTRSQYESLFRFVERNCRDHVPGGTDDEGNLILPMT